MLEKGEECDTVFNNYQEACSYYDQALELLKERYGESSPICDYICKYTYIEEERKGQYRAAMLKLSKAGNFLHKFDRTQVVDRITNWIFENRTEQLQEVVRDTWNAYYFLDSDYSIEKNIATLMLSIGDLKEGMNKVVLDSAGLPRCFDYLFEELLTIKPEVGKEEMVQAAQALSYIMELQNSNLKDLSQNQKVDIVNKITGTTEMFSQIPLGAGGFSQYLDSSALRIFLLAILGLTNIDKPEEAEEKLKSLSDRRKSLIYTVDKIKIDLIECYLKIKQEKQVEARKILDHILEIEENLVLQVFTMRGELKKLEFLSGLASIQKSILHVCLKVQGFRGAYTHLLRYRTLTMDFFSIGLGGEEGTRGGTKILEYEQSKKEGKLTRDRSLEFQQWFDECSQGIFKFEAEDVCHRLLENQVVLEFSKAEDESQRDYYLVFVVLWNKVLVLDLGKCEEIDPYLMEVYSYMKDYSCNRFSSQHIRRLPAYWKLYEKLMKPIGEMLPSKIRSCYIVAEGAFSKLPFEVFPCFQWYDQFLGEEYQLSYLNTGRDLLVKRARKVGRGCVVIGAPDFSPSTEYPPLPLSFYEVQKVSEILGVTPYTGTAATASCLKKMPEILHISTHSYYKPEKDQEQKDPMMREGLVFAKGELLSARDIGCLDLKGTNLTVLSVCNEGNETDIYNDVGMGVRRAFINAGTRYLILNLWKTDDMASDLFMECFYTFYRIDKMEIREALRNARLYIKEKSIKELRKGPYYHKEMERVFSNYDEEVKPYSHPYYWAGFILTGM